MGGGGSGGWGVSGRGVATWICMTTVVVVKDGRRVVDSKVVGSYRDVGVGTWICRASAVVVVVAGKTTEGAKLRHTRLLVLLA